MCGLFVHISLNIVEGKVSQNTQIQNVILHKSDPEFEDFKMNRQIRHIISQGFAFFHTKPHLHFKDKIFAKFIFAVNPVTPINYNKQSSHYLKQ